MGSRDPRVDAYISKAAPFAQPILAHLREVVHAGCPEVVETIKWSRPFFDFNGPLCGFAAFKAHCAFMFWKGEAFVASVGATFTMRPSTSRIACDRPTMFSNL